MTKEEFLSVMDFPVDGSNGTCIRMSFSNSS
jgi:hypothetical protein